MRKLIERYVRKKVWLNSTGSHDTLFSDMEYQVRWVMKGYPFHWRTRLWAATHCGYRSSEELHEWLMGKLPNYAYENLP